MAPTTNLPDRLPLLSLDGIVLKHGNHEDRASGVCALEAAAWLAGLPHSDAPACVCPVIRSFVIAWNDAIPDDARRTALLKPFLVKMLDTNSTKKVELKRSYLAFDWLVRVQTPAWLDLSPGLKPHAEKLRALVEITDAATIDAASPVVHAARAAAWAAARDAARARLQPAVEELQASAADLLDRMIAVKG